MASSSKQKTDEEIQKELEDSRKVTLTSATGLGSGKLTIGTNGASSYGDVGVGNEYAVLNDGGREYINIGGERAYWDDAAGGWAGSGYDGAGGNHRGAMFNTFNSPVQQAQSASPAAPVGAPPPAKPDWRDNIDMTQGEGSAGSGDGLTTDEIVDNSGMQNWMAMGPQTQGEHINALVDPANWQYQVDPANQRVRNLGRYRNPMLDEWMDTPFSQGGLLALNTGGLLNG